MNQETQVSVEQLLYPMFYRTTVQRKLLDFNRLWDRSAIQELPRSCVLHLIDDNFLLNKPIVFAPEDDNWLLGKRPNIKFINHVVQPVKGVIPFKEEFFLPQKGVIPTLLNFRKKTLRWMRIWKDTTQMPPLLNSQAVISYLSLYRARIFGQLKATRRFNYILTSVLNNVCKLPNQMHFIPIPVGATEYTRGEFVPSFKEYTKTTIRHPNDPWYQFLMHLYGFMHTNTDSIFSKLPKGILKNIHLVLYNYKHCLVVNLQNLLDFNQGIKDVVLIRFIKQMNLLASQGQALSFTDYGAAEPNVDEDPEIDSKGIDESNINSDDIDDVINVIERATPPKGLVKLSAVERPDEIVVREEKPSVDIAEATRFSRMSTVQMSSKILDRYKRILTDNNIFNLAKGATLTRQRLAQQLLDIMSKQPESPTAVQYDEPDPKSIHAANPMAKPAPSINVEAPAPVVVTKREKPELVKEENPSELLEEQLPIIDEVEKSYVTIQPKLVNNGRRIVNAPAYTSAPSVKAQEEFNKSTTDDIDLKATEVISQHTEMTKAQAERAMKLSQVYKTIKFEDKTLQEIMDSQPDDSVASSELDFLKDQVPDKSMLKSTVDKFDTEYIDKFFKRDLIMELSSFNKVGMFLKDLKFTDVSDSMNNMYEVRAQYEDLNHKTHTVRFTVPKVDKRGYCYINGGLKVLKKQRITNPICKVSPVRVTLSSDYNKYLVERVTTVAHSFINYIDKIVEASNGAIIPSFGTAKLPLQTYPYEFTAISRKYTSLTVKDSTDGKPWFFFFNSPDKMSHFFTQMEGIPDKVLADAIDNEDEVKGYLIGIKNSAKPVYVYMKLDGSVAVYNADDGVTADGNTFIDLLCELCNLDISHLSEWTELKLLSKSIPTIFALAYRYGLSYMLNYTKCKYAIYDRKARYPKRQSDVIIKFKDKVLIVPRAPLCYSLLFAGLNNYDLTKYNMEEMDEKDVYYDLLQSKKMSVHNLKGIDNFFDMFVDPITRDVLFRMGEPTEAKDLLIRATTLLTTEDHPPVAASTNYRFRSYERICTAVYKILANQYSTYRYRGIGTSNTFSIKDFEITNMVMNDQLMEPVDQINPINDIIYREEYGHGGAGGRQSTDTFMVEDRQWPEDGVGIIGESSVDNGKTGYAGNMSNNPTIDNIRGLTLNKKIEDIEPSEAFTSTSLLGPCVINDDSKR